MRTAIVLALLAAMLPPPGRAQGPLPATPTNLIAHSPAELQPRILLSWNGSGGPAFYKVYRATADTASFLWIGIAQSTKFEDRSVSAGVLYHYTVTAVLFQDSAILESPRSNIASVRAYTLPAGPKGVITGLVTDAVSGFPIPKVRIRFFTLRQSANRTVEAVTDEGGFYTAAIDTGTYLIRAEEAALTVAVPPHIPEWFDNATGPDFATPVMLTLGDTVTADFALSPSLAVPYVYVSGTVTDEQGTPLPGAAVALVRPIQEMNTYAALTATSPGVGPEAKIIPGIGYTRGVVWIGFTNPAGKYFAQVLSGRQYAAMAALDGYFPEVYENAADPTQATLLTIQQDTSGIDFSLKAKSGDTGSMQGSVEDEEGGDVPARIILFPRPKGGDERPAVFVHTDSSGEFEFNDLPAGSYAILAIPYSEYAAAYYTESGPGAISWIDGDSVVINGSPSTLTLTLPRLQSLGLTRISGTVRAANTTPLSGVRIVARATDGSLAGYGITDQHGRYAVDAVTAGPLTLFVDRFQYNLVQAPVSVPQNAFSLAGVDFVLTTTFPTGLLRDEPLPTKTRLLQNYPNPFNPFTTIRYSIGTSSAGPVANGAQGGEESSANRQGTEIGTKRNNGWVRLIVYDILGREVAVLVDEPARPGVYEAIFNATGLASGVYFARLTTDSGVQTSMMNLLR